jgi:4-hydroxybenzoate polyprenyltransferase
MLTQPQPHVEPVWQSIVRLLRWDKPAGRLILMLPALWAVVLAADGLPPLPLVGVIVLGSLSTSAAGCVVNDLWDRNIDPHVSRTRNRPLASRALSAKVGIGVAIVAFVCAWVLASYLNPLSYWLCVTAVPFIVFYPSAKRFFPVPQLVMALAWGFGVLISWSAVTGSLTLPAWLLWGATVCWALGFDTAYAMADREDDERLGVQSSPRFFGAYTPLAVGFCFAGTAALLAALGVVLSLGSSYWLALAVAIGGWGWHYLQLRPQTPDASIYARVFRQNVWIGFVLLLGMELGAMF